MTIAFEPELTRMTGNLEAALLLSQFIYWHTHTPHPAHWFYKSQAEWLKETGLSRYGYEKGLRVLLDLGEVYRSRYQDLVKMGILEQKKYGGLSNTWWFRVDSIRLDSLLSKCPAQGEQSALPTVNKAITEDLNTISKHTTTATLSAGPEEVVVVEVENQHLVFPEGLDPVAALHILEPIESVEEKQAILDTVAEAENIRKTLIAYLHGVVRYWNHEDFIRVQEGKARQERRREITRRALERQAQQPPLRPPTKDPPPSLSAVGRANLDAMRSRLRGIT